MVRIADYCQNPQAACDGPRFRVVQGMQITVEDGFPVATMNELRRRGHELVTVDDYNQFGSCQAIWRLDDGYLVASDPRRDGSSGRLLSADEFSPRGKLIASTHGHPNPPQSLVPHAEIGPDRLDPAPCHA